MVNKQILFSSQVEMRAELFSGMLNFNLHKLLMFNLYQQSRQNVE